MYGLLTFHVQNPISLFHCLGCTKGAVHVRHMYPFHNKVRFYAEELLVHLQPPNWKTTPCQLSVTAFSVYHSYLYWKLFSISNLRTCHAVVTGTQLPWNCLPDISFISRYYKNKFFCSCIILVLIVAFIRKPQNHNILFISL